MNKNVFFRILLIPIIYFIVSAVYIVFSDWILLSMIDDIGIYRKIQTYKGWAFVTFSAILIYFLVKNLISKLDNEYQKESELQIKLQTNESNYYELFKNNPIPMWIYDIENLRYLDVNNSAINHYGYSFDEFMQMTIKDIRPKEDIDKLIEDVYGNSNQISNPKIWRHIKKDGTLIYVEIKSHSFEFNGKNARNVMVYDITEKLLLNNELVKARRNAEESDNLKSALLQNISHEIRTPLNGILGLSSLLLQDDLDSQDKKEFTDLIKKSSNRLINTIENLIELSKVQSGEIKINPEMTHINSIINELFESFYPQCEFQKLELISEKSLDDDNCIYLLDGKKLYQIFEILLSNACKFTHKGKIVFGYKIENNFLMCYVRDTGIGIKREYFDKIFDSFFQIESSISRNYEGSGVGLTICREFVTRMGGEISLDSYVNEGTMFTFKLPI